MHIALYKPDIPQNTAAIIRLSSCLGLKVHIVEPCGFSLEDRRFKRVVMDYIGLSKIFRYADYDIFLKKNSKSRIILMTTKAKQSYLKFKFKSSDILLFGRESAGVPDNVHKIVDHRLTIPMKEGVRSINLSSSVALVLGEGLRQINSI